VFEKTFVSTYLFVGVRLIGVKQGKKTIVQSRGGDFLVARACGFLDKKAFKNNTTFAEFFDVSRNQLLNNRCLVFVVCLIV
jgi:hypothetical protein